MIKRKLLPETSKPSDAIILQNPQVAVPGLRKIPLNCDPRDALQEMLGFFSEVDHEESQLWGHLWRSVVLADLCLFAGSIQNS